jgi:hypothetical protein
MGGGSSLVKPEPGKGRVVLDQCDARLQLERRMPKPAGVMACMI